MKKFLSLALALVMIFALAAMGIPALAVEDAADPLPISSAADFAAMEAKGVYYLTADIDLSSVPTYVGTFAGTLDGRGHKIKVKNTLFENFAGTATDIELIPADAAGITTNADRAGVFANNSGDCTLKNIVNRVNLNGSMDKVTATDDLELKGLYGGLIGNTAKKATVTLENCVNYAKVSGYEPGGLIGKSHAYTKLINCANYGEITGTDCVGALVSWQYGDFEYFGCKNGDEKTFPLITSDTDGASGTIGYVSGSTDGTIDGCVNFGPINSKSSPAGGLLGRAGEKDGITMKNCVNYAKISGSHAGGIVGQDQGSIIIENCFNYGELNGQKQAAGIIASLGASKTEKASTISYCGNFGKVTAGSDTAAGIIAYANGSTARVLTIIGCFNVADVKGGCEASGILGYINGCPDLKVQYCFNTGKVETTDSSQTALGIWYSKVAVNDGNIKGNLCLADCAAKEYRNGDSYVDMKNTATAAEFASGKIAYELNAGLGEERFFQFIGKDATPLLDENQPKVLKNGDVYSNPVVEQPQPETGDSIVWVLVVALISVLGMGIAFRTSKN